MLGLAPVQQDYLLEARQMQSLSFAVHIPLVCFGVGFPAMVLFVEWLVPSFRPQDPACSLGRPVPASLPESAS
jgi:cytochrome d ubiquinol oxidase subunit I